MNRFSEQVAIVAGGARGIGKGVGQRLASEGCKIFVFDVLEKELQNTIDEFKDLDLNAEGELVDITNQGLVQSSIEKVVRDSGRLDVMVNCAGIVGETSVNAAEYSLESFDRVVDINLKGAFLLTKYAIPPMLPNNYGRILHVASIGGKEGNPGMVGYAASKSGLMGLVKGVGKEYAETGITVNGLAPAVVATDMLADATPEMIKYMTDKIPMKRLGTIEEVAAIICWIVSPEASFNTGFVFDISGGRATF